MLLLNKYDTQTPDFYGICDLLRLSYCCNVSYVRMITCCFLMSFRGKNT